MGFDEVLGYLTEAHARDVFTDRIWRYAPRLNFKGEESVYQNQNGGRGRYLPDLLTSAAAHFMQINKPDWANRHRAFFLCLSYPLFHDQPVPSEEPYAEEPWPDAEKRRAAAITHLDACVGRLMQALEQLKINTNTVICFTSVSGAKKEGGMDPKFFNSNGALRGANGSVYEAGLRVPMILWWPARIAPGQVSDLAWVGWDLLPTAAEIAITEPPTETDGISVFPTLVGGTQTNQHDVLYWETSDPVVQQAVRLGEWKGVLISNETNTTPELYNLKTDTSEKDNVAGKNPRIEERVSEVFAEHAKSEK